MPTIRGMNQDAVINRLLARGEIARTERRGRYTVRGMPGTYRRDSILAIYTIEVVPGRYRMNPATVHRPASAPEQEVAPEPAPEPASAPVLRTVVRNRYHSSTRDIAGALARIAPDADGVKRSFGLEWEIYSLTPLQEDKLARLLDTLPEHVTEADGSLSDSGVEIVFMPLGKEEYLRTWAKLKRFCVDNAVSMNGTGAHTTYGVSNLIVTRQDLQIRLNRIALAVKSVGTQGNIKRLFGRDFSNYCMLPTSTTTSHHSNAFSAHSRNNTCWELRLMDWNANIEKVVEFMSATEFVFREHFKASHFNRIFELLGSDTCGE